MAMTAGSDTMVRLSLPVGAKSPLMTSTCAFRALFSATVLTVYWMVSASQ